MNDRSQRSARAHVISPNYRHAVVDGAQRESWEVVDHAIRRTLEAPHVQFRLYHVSVNDDDSWSGELTRGRWRSDASELITKSSLCHGAENFPLGDPRDSYPTFAVTRSGTRTTWHIAPPSRDNIEPEPRRCCVHHLDHVPADPANLVQRWRTVIAKTIEYELTVPAPAPTPFELLADLSAGGFELFDPPSESESGQSPGTNTGLYGIKYRGVVQARGIAGRSLPWIGYVRVNDQGCVASVQLHWKIFRIWTTLEYEDVASVADTWLAGVPEPIDVELVVSVGNTVEMPDHPYDIDEGVFGPLDDLGPDDPGWYNDFQVIIDGPPDEVETIVDAIVRASPRIMALTMFGRELTTDEERDVASEFEVCTPDYASDPRRLDGGVGLHIDWNGAVMPVAAHACLRVVVQELLAGDVAEARIRCWAHD